MAPDHTEEDGVAGRGIGRRGYLQTVGTVAAGGALGASSTGSVAASGHSIDVGTVVTDDEWTTVDASADHSEPIVVAGPISHNGGQPATTRLRNVSGSSFDMRVEEWEYLDGNHKDEEIGYLVTDTGAGLADGNTDMVAGTVWTDQNWQMAEFPSSFGSGPVVFSQLQTYLGHDQVVTRNSTIRKSHFAVRLQEEEGGDGGHLTEKIGYLAVERGTGTIDGRPFEAGIEMVSSNWKAIDFQRSYDDPVVFADFQTFQGGNTANIRYRNVTDSSVAIQVDEEQSQDDETGHMKEQIGYLVVEGGDTGSSGGGSGGGSAGGYGRGPYGAGAYGQ